MHTYKIYVGKQAAWNATKNYSRRTDSSNGEELQGSRGLRQHLGGTWQLRDPMTEKFKYEAHFQKCFHSRYACD